MFLVNVDNVGSKQMQHIRIALRGKAVVLMGKNTTIRKAMRGHFEQNPNLEKVLPHIKGNIGFVFMKDDMSAIREIISANQVSNRVLCGACVWGGGGGGGGIDSLNLFSSVPPHMTIIIRTLDYNYVCE